MTREPGDKIIPKLIPVIRDTIIATKRGLASHEKRVRTESMQEIIDRMGHEMAEVARPIMSRMLAEQQLPDDVHEMLVKATSGEHQWQSTVLTVLGMTGATSALGTVISNFAYPVTRDLIASSPHLTPNPGDMAQLVARNLVDPTDAEYNAAGQGFNAHWFGAMVEAAANYPAASDIQELLRRGQIDQAEAIRLLTIQAVPEPLAQMIVSLASQELSPADAALAVLRGNMSETEGLRVASENGLTAEQFNVLIGNTGEPPGVMDMLTMHRRGIIDQATLIRGILQSRVRNEWIPALLGYQFQPMTTADAIDAAVQNHLSVDQARQIALLNGLEASAFDPLAATAGEPLSKTEMLRLFRQGKVTVDQVKQALRESRLKDKYVDTALELSVQIPPLFTIRAMITSGSITDEQAAELLHEDGYQDFVIKAVIHSAHKQKTVKVKELTEGMLSALYQEQAITAVQFREQLKAHGYTDAEAVQIQQIDDWRIAKANRDNAISHLRSMYVGGKIDSAKVQAELNALQVPSDMRDKLMADWDLERSATVRMLTEAQIVAAWKIGIIDAAHALARLIHLGYTGADAGILLEIANKGPLGG
jgi:hypothetical protein